MTVAAPVVEYKRRKDYPEHKKSRIEEIRRLLASYRYIILLNITGVTAQVLHETRSVLRRRGSVLKVIKNTLTKLAIDRVKSEKPGIEKLKEYLTGQNAAVFTNENPFEVCLFLARNKIAREARPGDVATSDIVIPKGNTGLPPGPIISLFNRVGVPTTIREGSIFVMKDTKVASAGDVISAELAELLGKLGMKPIETSIEPKAAFLDGHVLAGDDLKIDIDSCRNMIVEAQQAATNLAVNAAVPIPETLELAVAKAHAEALSLAVNAGIVTRETAPMVLARAFAAAQALFEAVKSKKPELAA